MRRANKSTNSSSLLCLIRIILFCLSISVSKSSAFQSDELLIDDEEFGLEGGIKSPDTLRRSTPSPQDFTRKRSSDLDTDSKIQFTLEHAFGNSDFSPAGTFSARLKTWNHGGQTLTKLRFSRNVLTEDEKHKFEELLRSDDFYTIRLPSNVVSPPGKEYIISSVKARCLPRVTLNELFIIHSEGVNIVAVNYGSAGACQYPRQLKFPVKWSFNSHTVMKNSEQAPRTPVFTEEIIGGTESVEDEEGIKPPERTFWAKYWMYAIPLGLVVMNAVTQAMNLPEEQAGQPASHGQQPTAAIQRGTSSAARRRV